MYTLLLRTAPGLEDLVRKEALSCLRAADPSAAPVKGRSGRGWVEIAPSLEADPALLIKELHTVFRGVEVKARTNRGEAEAASAAADCARKGGFRELRHRDAFRITCYAPEEPSGTVRAVEQRVGEAAVSASGAPVDLTSAAVNYGVEFLDGHIWYGTILKDEEDTPRYRKLFQVRSSLKAHIAAAMLDLSGFRSRPGTVLDPCCGSGTILMEAAALHPGGRYYGCDIDPHCAEGAQKNLNALSRADAGSRIYEGDARALGDLFPAGSIDYIVTNPPFGIRTGKQLNFFAFYRDLLKGAGRVLKAEGRIALLVGRKRGIFNRAAEEDGSFKIHHVRVIDASGLFPALYILRRKG